MSWKDKFPKENIYFQTDKGILYNAEAIKIMSKFPKKTFDAIITDPPYGLVKCKWDVVIPFEDMWRELKRIRKDRAPIALFGSEPFASLLRVSNLKEYKYDWIWKKERPTNPLSVKKQPPRYTDNILVFYKKQPKFYSQKIKRKEENKRRNKPRCYKDKTKVDTDRYEERVLSGTSDYIYQPNILEFSMERGLHPTQKPIKLIEFLLKVYTNIGDLVLDFTCGSGTTLVACEKLNRRWVGIELKEKYCKITKERILNELER